jgi:hypothetical protein
MKLRSKQSLCIWFFPLISTVTMIASDKHQVTEYSDNEGNVNRIYVREDAMDKGDGRSWQTAYSSIQMALDQAEANTEIWVAKGTYFPEQKVGGKNKRNKSFQLKNNVILLGGFSGDETNPEERNWLENKTILSGDLKGDDQNGAHREDNSYHVVTGNRTDSTAVLDGFVITGGNADRRKWPDDGGGGMNNHDGSPTVINCLFEKNQCYADGGGMRNWGDAEPRIIQTVFRENRSEQEGGGMMNGPDSRTLVLNCRFIRNHSAEDGGGIYNNETRRHLIMNCLFYQNTAALTGGALYHVNHSQTMVVNCTLTQNRASEAGGAISNRDSDPVLINCILWENRAPENAEINNMRSEPSVSYSNVSGGYRGANNMIEDPAFANGYELSASSPCIDRGKNEAVPDRIRLDLNLHARIINGIVDLGAFEYNDK